MWKYKNPGYFPNERWITLQKLCLLMEMTWPDWRILHMLLKVQPGWLPVTAADPTACALLCSMQQKAVEELHKLEMMGSSRQKSCCGAVAERPLTQWTHLKDPTSRSCQQQQGARASYQPLFNLYCLKKMKYLLALVPTGSVIWRRRKTPGLGTSPNHHSGVQEVNNHKQPDQTQSQQHFHCHFTLTELSREEYRCRWQEYWPKRAELGPIFEEIEDISVFHDFFLLQPRRVWPRYQRYIVSLHFQPSSQHLDSYHQVRLAYEFSVQSLGQRPT